MPETFPVADKDLYFPHAFLLSASAGSGKTYNLSNRYIQFLLSPVIKKNDLSSILAITFTENATKEMKGRIIGFLKELYFSSEKRKEIMRIVSISETDLIKKADEKLELIFSSYPDFNVHTIDSFILKILSVSLDELGIPPDYEIIFDDRLLVDRALADFLDSFDVENGKKMIDEFLQSLNYSSAEKFIFNPVARIKEKFSQFIEKENRYLKDIKTVSVDIKKHEGMRKKIIKKILEMYEKNKELNIGLYKEADRAISKKDNLALIKSYKPKNGLYLSSALKDETKKSQVSRYIEEIDSLLRKYWEMDSLAFYKPFADFYIKFRDNFYKQYRKDKTVSLSQVTADISRRISKQSVFEIYIKLAARLNHFLIDEFQDTNLAQWNIIRPLVEDSLAGYGSLFLIGDVKQAIYMFRNADYRIMSDFLSGKASKYINTGSLKYGVENFGLSYNYRSAGEIVDYVNSFFSSAEFVDYLEDKAGGDYACFNKSTQEAIQEIKGKGYVRNLVLIAEKKEEDKEILKQEFIKIAEDVISRFDKENVAVLVKKNDEVETVVSWLGEIGINAASFSSLDIRKRKVIAELKALLTFLDRPSDDFSFGTFISGDIFSRSAGKELKSTIDNFLFECASRDNLLYIYFREKFPDIWDKFFDELFSKSGYLTCYELINLAIAKFSVYSNFKGKAPSIEKGEDAFLIKLLDIAYSLSACGKSSIADLLYELENGNSHDEKFSVRMPEFVPAVKVMTFHKAKGLGFDAVINIFDQNSWHLHGGEKIYYENSNGGLELRRVTKEMAEFSPDLKKIREYEKREERIQDLNTLYVALTRARFELVNIIIRSKKTESVLSLFNNDYEKGKKENFVSSSRKETTYLDISCEKLKRVYDFIKNGEGDTIETLRGNVYHKILASIKLYSQANEKNVSFLVDKACLFYGLNWREEKREVVEKVIKTVNDLKEYFLEKDGRLIRNEAEFTIEKGRIIRVDRLIEDRDQSFIIDYKTGNPEDYSDQIKKYINAISKALGKPATGVVYFIDYGKIHYEN